MKKKYQYNQGITKKNTNTEANFIEFQEGNEKKFRFCATANKKECPTVLIAA